VEGFMPLTRVSACGSGSPVRTAWGERQGVLGIMMAAVWKGTLPVSGSKGYPGTGSSSEVQQLLNAHSQVHTLTHKALPHHQGWGQLCPEALSSSKYRKRKELWKRYKHDYGPHKTLEK
jgi:hypothetical protein